MNLTSFYNNKVQLVSHELALILGVDGTNWRSIAQVIVAVKNGLARAFLRAIVERMHCKYPERQNNYAELKYLTVILKK